MDDFERGQFEFKEVSNRSNLKATVEALLFVSGDPLEIRDIASHLEISIAYTKDILEEMMEDYKHIERGIKLISINGAYQLVTKNEYSDYIQKLLKKNKRQSLSQASLESLAIIAYKQPITRIDIDEIRGVKSESAIQKLVERDLIKEVGRLEVPGRPILYGTTEEFLRQFGLHGLHELPSLDLFILEEEEALKAQEVAVEQDED
ncbi:segregation and condensation protein B [Clostridium sp. DSM 8431]|uniref:SMC-Scp complex subunit ScpB n=1 Tax=Clostridium sp. DSM 8431 TaxID=1761781 RepID=UPI0008E8773A|nr:SMC-Scp complex subunit ScpB [Clostridium sp. DSM 8431]SFU45242.1 segregation and condensation protein B [Clostridium sp. DSM 8431]